MFMEWLHFPLLEHLEQQIQGLPGSKETCSLASLMSRSPRGH